MSRIIIPGARTASAQRRATLPPWLKGRASLYFDPTDDRAAGTIPADLTGDSAFTLMARLRPMSVITATNRGALSIGQNGADTGAFLGQVVSGGRAFIGGGLIGTTLADTMPSPIDEWTPAMIRYAGGVNGALTLVVKDRSTAGVCTANITTTVAELGRLLAAGTCFGGCVSDARVYSRAVSDREYDAWRDGLAEPVTSRRFWSCENPGYGTTVHERDGNTDDAITGGVWLPEVPFRRRRVIENVAACPRMMTAATDAITIAHHADIDPGAGSWGVMGWVLEPTKVNTGLIGKIASAGYPNVPGWFCYGIGSGILSTIIKDGVNTASVQSRPVFDGWHHLAVVRDTASGLLMVFRNAQAPVTVSGAAVGSLTSAANLSLHRIPGITTCTVPGSSNDWVWRKGSAFTWDEIEAHCCDGILPSGGIGWGIREGAGTTAVSVPAGYNGTLSAASWTTQTRCKSRTAA